jgi:peptidoglycan/LPS O-acetylase OafA/YrhL
MLQVPPATNWPTANLDVGLFWSLSIEEHFYLFWPLVVARTNMRQLKRVCCILFCFSFLARLAWITLISSDTLIVVQTPFRLDPLVAGAFLAITARDGSWAHALPWAKWLALLLPVPLIIFFLVMKGLWSSHWMMESFGVSTVAILFVSLIMLCLEAAHTIPARVAASGILRFFGKYNVTHGFAIGWLGDWVSVKTWLAATGSEILAVVCILAIKLVASVAVAMLSWHLLEKHFLKLKSWFEPTKPLGAPLPASALV